MRDLTGDGVPELMISEWHFRILACKDGQYYQALDLPYSTEATPGLVDVQDMNLDGVPEIIVSRSNIVAVDRPESYQILEWNGDNFQQLIDVPDTGPDCNPYSAYEAPCAQDGWIESHGYARSLPPVQVADIDHNGTRELILNDGIGSSFDAQYNGPWRDRTTILMWNGRSFTVFKRFLEPPRYRFQALQDADQAALRGNYDEALRLYNQVISSQNLEWWSEERQAYEFDSRYSGSGTPTPTQPAPDPSEFVSLAAYARFRIVVTSLLRGDLPQAESIYNALQTQAQGGNSGHPYAQMAKAFWDEYQSTSDLGQACDKAVAFAAEHQTEILYYVGGRHHGFQSPTYEPRDICPFG